MTVAHKSRTSAPPCPECRAPYVLLLYLHVPLRSARTQVVWARVGCWRVCVRGVSVALISGRSSGPYATHLVPAGGRGRTSTNGTDARRRRAGPRESIKTAYANAFAAGISPVNDRSRCNIMMRNGAGSDDGNKVETDDGRIMFLRTSAYPCV